MKNRNRIILLLLLLATTFAVSAQESESAVSEEEPEASVIRANCLQVGDADGDGIELQASARATRRGLPSYKTNWEPSKTYRQAVVLIEFADKGFRSLKPRESYDSIFNFNGFNKGAGPGCVAEYFREQSGGLLNIQFDIFGPYKMNHNARLNPKAKVGSMENGSETIAQATRLWVDEDRGRDHSVYDWDGDKKIDQVIYVFASYSGNTDADSLSGYLWPNTANRSVVSAIKTADGYSVYQCSASAEMRTGKRSWGFGTICHEYAHCFGLPDIYPVSTDSNAGYSVVDEWDLMDGGNYTNDGCCPPSFSGLERMLMGWQSPIELTEPTTITDMKPLSEGGPVYMVRHSDKEYYLLENRQWTGWDTGLPGRGLVVFHVDYNASRWADNIVNSTRNHRGYQIVHADNRDYDAWDNLLADWGDKQIITGQYQTKASRMNSYYLSMSAYPWTNDDTGALINALTDTTTPASVMIHENAAGSTKLSKAITNIRVSDAGLVSFDFMGGDPSKVEGVLTSTLVTHVYDLRGCCVGNRVESQRPGIYIVRYNDGSTKKVVKR